MKYKIIFTCGIIDDDYSLAKELRSDVLIMDEEENYYNPQFITIDRIKGEFDNAKKCYLEDNMVILHKITHETILESIPELYKWLFFMHWRPLTKDQLEKYFHPKENWVILDIDV